MRRQRRAPCCDAQHRAKPEAQVLRGKELDQKEHQLVAEVVASKEQQILVSRWREEDQAGVGAKDGAKRSTCCKASCKSEDFL